MLSLVFGTVTLLTAGAGIVTGVDGVSKIDEAKQIERDARLRVEKKREMLKQLYRSTQELATEYAHLQIQVHFQTIDRFAIAIAKRERFTSQNTAQITARIAQVSPQQIHKYRAILAEIEPLAASYLGAVNINPLESRSQWAKAIDPMTLAWLGGGSCAAAGGASWALGSAIVGGAVAAPLLALGGWAIGRTGGKSLADSCRYEQSATAQIAKLNTFEDLLWQIQRRISALRELVTSLNDRALVELAQIESQQVSKCNAETLARVTRSIATLAEILTTPVLTPDGNLAQSHAPIAAKYLLFRRQSSANSELVMTK